MCRWPVFCFIPRKMVHIGAFIPFFYTISNLSHPVNDWCFKWLVPVFFVLLSSLFSDLMSRLHLPFTPSLVPILFCPHCPGWRIPRIEERPRNGKGHYKWRGGAVPQNPQQRTPYPRQEDHEPGRQQDHPRWDTLNEKCVEVTCFMLMSLVERAWMYF